MLNELHNALCSIATVNLQMSLDLYRDGKLSQLLAEVVKVLFPLSAFNINFHVAINFLLINAFNVLVLGIFKFLF